MWETQPLFTRSKWNMGEDFFWNPSIRNEGLFFRFEQKSFNLTKVACPNFRTARVKLELIDFNHANISETDYFWLNQNYVQILSIQKMHFRPHLSKNLTNFDPLKNKLHIISVLIGVKYQNCCQTLDVYLHFAIWIMQFQIKLLNNL